jgi:hypothetical protein
VGNKTRLMTIGAAEEPTVPRLRGSASYAGSTGMAIPRMLERPVPHLPAGLVAPAGQRPYGSAATGVAVKSPLTPNGSTSTLPLSSPGAASVPVYTIVNASPWYSPPC